MWGKKKNKKDQNGDIPSHDELIKLGLDPNNFSQNVDVQIDHGELDTMLNKDIEDVQVDLNEEDENDHDLSAELDNLNSNEDDDENVDENPPKKLKKMLAELKDNLEYYNMTKSDGNEDDAANTLEEIAELKKQITEFRKKHNLFDENAIKIVLERTQQYKKAALNAKKAGNMEKAREFLNTSKVLTSYQELLNNGEELPIDLKKLPAEPKFDTSATNAPVESAPPTKTETTPTPTKSVPPTQKPQDVSNNPPSRTVPQKPTEVLKPQPKTQPVPKKKMKKIVKKKVKRKVATVNNKEMLEKKKKMEEEENKRVQAYEKFIVEFSNQMRNCLEKAKEFRSINKVEAANYSRQYKADKEHLQKILEAKNLRGTPLPKFHMVDKQVKNEKINEHLKEEEMEIEIIKGIDIKDDSGPCDTYVTFEYGYPKENGTQTITTPTVKASLTPVYEFKKILAISRKKSFLNYVERKKIVFEVFKPGSFLKKAVSLGSLEVKLDDLIKKSEIYQVVQLIKSRKPTGGKLEIKIKLRKPLEGSDVTIINERFIIIDQHFDAPKDLQEIDVNVVEEQFVYDDVETEVEYEVDDVEQTISNNNNNQSVSSAPTSSSDQPLSMVHDDPKRLCSLKVIEWELLRLSKQTLDSDLEVRKISLEGTQQVIIAKIQNNLMSMGDYVKSVNAAILNEKKIAQTLKNNGDLENARICMHRIKLMNEELQEASQIEQEEQEEAPVKQPPTKEVPVKQPPVKETPVKQPPPVKEAPVKQAPVKQPVKGIPAPTTATLEDPHNVDSIVSISVFDHEILYYKQLISKANNQEKMDLEDTLSDLELKRNLLMMQIENELISMEQYVEKVQKKIKEEKSLAVALNKAGKKIDAHRCLARAKKMESELNS